MQDRRFHENNQWDYRADYDPDGVAGPTAMINGTINPYFDVTTQKVRLRFLMVLIAVNGGCIFPMTAIYANWRGWLTVTGAGQIYPFDANLC